VADGALVVFGGALLLTPGFATDLFGLACVLPPSRAVLRRLLTGFVTRRLGEAVGGPLGPLGTTSRPSSSRLRRHGRVVDGEVVDGQVVDGPDGDQRRT
jgi:UPF0716 protein FxsA